MTLQCQTVDPEQTDYAKDTLSTAEFYAREQNILRGSFKLLAPSLTQNHFTNRTLAHKLTSMKNEVQTKKDRHR